MVGADLEELFFGGKWFTPPAGGGGGLSRKDITVSEFLTVVSGSHPRH